MSVGEDIRFEGLSYQVVGSGPPVIALHGLCETRVTWRYIVQLLENRFTFYLFDLKGHGQSERPRDGRYSLDDQASTFCRFIEDKKLTNVTIIGHSLGGGIALFIAVQLARAKKHPVENLILIDSIGAPQPIPFFIRAITFRRLFSLVLKVIPAATLVRQFLLRKAYLDPSKLSEEIISQYAENLIRPNGIYALSTTVRQLLAINAVHWLGEYWAINIPTLLLHGKADHIVQPYVGIQLDAAIQNSELEWLPSGHMPQEETPEMVAEQIERFVGKHSDRAVEADA